MKKSIRTLIYVLIFSVSAASCSPKFMRSDGANNNVGIENIYSSSEELLSAYKDNIEVGSVLEITSPLKNETDGLRYILNPYLDFDSTQFIGEENKEILESILLNNQSPYLSIAAEDWERIVQIIFSFDDNGKQALETYINDFAKENRIERQHAVSILMKLLPLRYPIIIDGPVQNLQKSEVISDLNEVDDRYQDLIRQAFCLGFTDFSVDKNRLFRPFDYLSSAEAVSMLYRILSNLGMPVSEQAREPGNEQLPAEDKNLPESTSNAFSIESIFLEYNDYKTTLEKFNKSSDKKRLEMLNLAEDIIGLTYDDFYAVDKPLTIEKWAKILNQVFGLESEEIDPYLCFETDGTLPYDIASISIFKISDKLVGYAPRDATDKELEAAKTAIPQFDTARDINKFAQMFSSGLLEGLYNIPGFTPQRPVNETEALLLVKRIVEGFTFK